VEQLGKGYYCAEMVANGIMMFCCQVIPCFIFIGLACAFQGVTPPPMTVSVALFPFWFCFSVGTLCCACMCLCGFCVSPETVDSAVNDAQEKAIATSTGMMEEAASGGMEDLMKGIVGGGADGGGGVMEQMANLDVENMTEDQQLALASGDFVGAGLTVNPMQAAMMKTMMAQAMKEKGVDSKDPAAVKAFMEEQKRNGGGGMDMA
jgi:hypothetical protein